MKHALRHAIVTLLVCVFTHTATSQNAVQFRIPITISSSTASYTCYIGISGDGPNPPGTINDNTIGMDTSAALFGAWREVPAAPAPPAPFDFDARIVTIPGRVSTFPTGLSGGVNGDYRGYISASQIDSFKIVIAGDFTDNFTTTVSWPTGLSLFGTVWTIKPQLGSDWPATNMLSATSVDIPAGGQKNIIIIKTGALPVELVSFTGALLSSGHVRLEWTTASEVNNYGFFVERRRQHESGFTVVPNGFVAGHGTTLEPHHYSFNDNERPASPVSYRLRQVDFSGATNYSEIITVQPTTGVGEEIPHRFVLEQNYPNPFNPTTTIKYVISLRSSVSLRVFDLLGREVKTLVNEVKQPGSYSVAFDASSVASGVYHYQLEAGSYKETKKLVVLK